MWLTDMDDDGLVDVVSADHTAHRGIGHKNPEVDSDELWQSRSIILNVRMPGDFVMIDLDKDGYLNWVGTSMTWGQAFIVEQVEPASSVVVTISLPDDFDKEITRLFVFLAKKGPVKTILKPIVASIENIDNDGEGKLDVDQLLIPSKDLVLALEDVGVTGEYHVLAVLYVEGGGRFQPDSGVDYMATSEKLTLGVGTVEVKLDLEPAP